MNRSIKTIAAAALSLSGLAAFAQDAIPPTWANEQTQPFVSTVSRAQVRAELDAARSNGSLNTFDNLAYMHPQGPGVTLAPVLAQVRDGAQRVAAAQAGSGLTRAQVRAELEAARRSGELNPFDNLAYMSAHPARAVVAPATLAQNSR